MSVPISCLQRLSSVVTHIVCKYKSLNPNMLIFVKQNASALLAAAWVFYPNMPQKYRKFMHGYRSLNLCVMLTRPQFSASCLFFGQQIALMTLICPS